jgi:hypothetical protein
MRAFFWRALLARKHEGYTTGHGEAAASKHARA